MNMGYVPPRPPGFENEFVEATERLMRAAQACGVTAEEVIAGLSALLPEENDARLVRLAVREFDKSLQAEATRANGSFKRMLANMLQAFFDLLVWLKLARYDKPKPTGASLEPEPCDVFFARHAGLVSRVIASLARQQEAPKGMPDLRRYARPAPEPPTNRRVKE